VEERTHIPETVLWQKILRMYWRKCH